MTLGELQKTYLSSSSEVRIAPEDFFILLAHTTKKEKIFLLAHPEYVLSGQEESTVKDFFKRRLKHEPIAYITGYKEFYGYDFRVTRDTLIPRGETELLVELVLNRISNLESGISVQKENTIEIVDIGTGSGNIIISLAKTLLSRFKNQDSRFAFYASDISLGALAIAKGNATRNHVLQNITFLHGDLLQPYLEEKLPSLDQIIITANLPYLSASIYADTTEDVHDFEPETALVSDQDGLDHYYRLLREVKDIRSQLKEVTLFLEISPEQTIPLTGTISSLFPKASIVVHKDLADKDRLVEIHLPKA